MHQVAPSKANRYRNQRKRVATPVVPLGAVRRATGKTLQDVCDFINGEYEFAKPVERGTISAIENGHRGASAEMLAAIAAALGLQAEEIDTKYKPRASRAVSETSQTPGVTTADAASSPTQ